EVPDGLIGIGVVVGEKAATVDLREDSGVSPPLTAVIALGLWYRADIDDVDDQQVTGLGAFDGEGAGEHVVEIQVDIAHVVGRIVVADLAVGPLLALHAEGGAGFDRGCRRDVRVPAVVSGDRLVGHRFVVVSADNYLGPRDSPICLGPAVGRTGRAMNPAEAERS